MNIVSEDVDTVNSAGSGGTFQGHAGSELALPASPSLVETFLALLILLADRRRMLGRLVFGFLVVGVGIAFLWKPSYTAKTTILPPEKSSSTSSMLAQLGSLSSLSSLSGGGMSSSADLYTGLLQSETVENAMVKRFKLIEHYGVKHTAQARKDLEQHTSIDGKQKDGMITLSVTDHSPAEAAEIANAYVEECRRLSESLAVSEASQRRLFLGQQVKQAKDKLASAEQDLKRTEERTGVIQIEGQERALIESAASLRAQLAAKEVQVQSMRTYSGEGNVNLIEAEQELAGLRAQIAKLNDSADDNSGSLISGRGQITDASLEYVSALREVKYSETMFDILARQYEAAKLDEAREGELLQVVDPAGIPEMKSGPSRALIVLGSAFLGLLLGVVWIVLSDLSYRLWHHPRYSSSFHAISRSLRS